LARSGKHNGKAIAPDYKERLQKAPKKVWILWVDACFDGFQYNVPKKKGVVNETIGYLVEDSGQFYVTAVEYCHDSDGIRHVQEIPKYAVIEMRELR
jgi:hypothetical protein